MSTAQLDVLSEITAQMPQRGAGCHVRLALARLAPDIAAAYAAAINGPAEDATAVAISRALRGRDVNLGESSVRRHRGDGCPCVDGL